MVKYLSGDFTAADFASCGVGFTGSAQAPRSSGRAPMASGGPARRRYADGGDTYKPTHEPADQPDTIDVDQEADQLRGGDFVTRLNRMRPLQDGRDDRMPNPGADYRYDPNKTRDNNIGGTAPPRAEREAAKGGRIRRADGGEVNAAGFRSPTLRKQDDYTDPGESVAISSRGLQEMRDGTPQKEARYRGALDAMDSAYGNEYPNAKRSTVFTEEDRANYPGFRKGGRAKLARGGKAFDLPEEPYHGETPGFSGTLEKIRPIRPDVDKRMEKDPGPDASFDDNVQDPRPAEWDWPRGEVKAKHGGRIKRASGGAMLDRSVEPRNEEDDEILNRGFHSTLRSKRTGDKAADKKMRTAAPPTNDDSEIDSGKHGSLDSRMDYDDDPTEAKRGGRIRRADGGPVNPGGKMITTDDWGAPGGISDQFAAQVRRPGGNRSPWPNLQSKDPELERHLRYMEAGEARNSAAVNEDEIATGEPLPTRMTDPEARARYHGFNKGGRIKRAIGGVTPGQAPAPGMQPMTRTPTQVPMGGKDDNPLSRATVSMPAEDVGRMALTSAAAGAKGAVSALAQRARSRGAQPKVMPGASEIAPAAVAPTPPQQSGLGVPNQMKKGGRIGRADGGPVNPGGKRVTKEQWRDTGDAFHDEVNNQGPVKGGRPDKWPNLSSDDPRLDSHFRWMEASGAKLSADENERAASQGVDPGEQVRWTSPDDAARYHGFRKGGGVLSAAKRHALPSSSFALPGKGSGSDGKGSGSYPIPDASHARNALARVSQHGSPEEKSRVRSAVHRKFPGIGKG